MVKIQDVSFSYSKEEAAQLFHINLSIKKGTFVLLCGKSGSGKTTVLKLINGLIPHVTEGDFTGTVQLDGRDTRNIKTYQIAEKVGSIFQNPKTQFFNLDTDSELAFGLENRGVPAGSIKKRVQEAVEALKIEHLRHRSVFALSGGEKQVLAIASVYAVNPELYVFDEPSANIDRDSMQTLRNIFIHLKAQGKTVVIAEHRLHYVIDLIDTAVYLENGRITHLFEGSVFQSMGDEKRKMLGLRTFTDSALKAVLSAPFDPASNLVIKNLVYGESTQPILNGINLSANCGDIIAVTGKSGSGKTTLMRCLCGLIKEKSGEIVYQRATYSAKKRRTLCYMVMQEVIHQLFAETVQEECRSLNSTVTDNTIEDMLKEIHLYEQRNRHPFCLSGGQMQRLATAAALLTHKAILIFDEPTSGLDYENMRAVGTMIKKWAQNAIVFLVTHDTELIAHTCTKIIRLSHGKIVAPVS